MNDSLEQLLAKGRPKLSTLLDASMSNGEGPSRVYSRVSIEGEDYLVQSLTEREAKLVRLCAYDDDGRYDRGGHELEDALFICLSLCDLAGRRLLTEADVERVSDWPTFVTQPIIAACNRLAAADDYESAKKNSEETQIAT